MLGIHGGKVEVYGILGLSEKVLLVIDTEKPAPTKLVLDPQTIQGGLGGLISPQMLEVMPKALKLGL